MMIKAYWGKYYVHVLSNRLLKGIKHTVNIDNISLIFSTFFRYAIPPEHGQRLEILAAGK